MHKKIENIVLNLRLLLNSLPPFLCSRSTAPLHNVRMRIYAFTQLYRIITYCICF